MDKILAINDVLETVSVAKGTLYEMMRQGRFPKSVSISTGRVGWRESDIAEWFERLSREGKAPMK